MSISAFSLNQRPGFYIPNPMGYEGPNDAWGPYPSMSFNYTPPGNYGHTNPGFQGGFNFGSTSNQPNPFLNTPVATQQPTFTLPAFNTGSSPTSSTSLFNNYFMSPALSSFPTQTTTTSTPTSSSLNQKPSWWNSSVFEPEPLNPVWSSGAVPFDWAETAPGLYGNVHGMSAILSRYVADTMPNAYQDPTAPGNTWIFCTMSSVDAKK